MIVQFHPERVSKMEKNYYLTLQNINATSRIIPNLLIRKKGLVKTVNFKNPKYVGDPLNAVKIFNEKSVDELIVTDIDASVKGDEPDYELIEKIAMEWDATMLWGGITNAKQARNI